MYFDAVKTNLGLVVSGGYARMARRVGIVVSSKTDPIRDFALAVDLLQRVSSEWGAARTLYASVEMELIYSDSEPDPASYSPKVQEVGSTLAALLPAVRNLMILDDSQSAAINALYRRLVGIYAGQLRRFDGPYSDIVPDDAAFRQLRRLDHRYGYSSVSLLPRVCPASLEEVTMHTLPVDHMWPALGVKDTARAIDFPLLRSLNLMYAFSSNEAQTQGWQLRALRFPALERLRLVCNYKRCPFVEQAEFPPELAMLDVTARSEVLEHIASKPVAVTKCIVLNVVSSESDQGVLAHVGRILEKARDGAEVALEIKSRSLRVPPESIACAALTSLRVEAPMTADAMLVLIQRLPRLVDLALGCVTLDNARLDVLIPGPGDPAPAPTSTALRRISVWLDGGDRMPEKSALVAKYLLLTVPTLVALISPITPWAPMVQFVGEYSARYPHLAQVNIVAHGV
ncbi:hypothetical protein H4R18_002066 [Coemansia javaensis]|uniref:Uncharacterized protein n=1 Tax=Coemansia javaensis TaxID=2761396 RepID=A0A9W8HDZ1_9FUNG|nr:hypothetical protein H4R18_002066 [Coemansia javaensis]